MVELGSVRVVRTHAAPHVVPPHMEARGTDSVRAPRPLSSASLHTKAVPRALRASAREDARASLRERWTADARSVLAAAQRSASSCARFDESLAPPRAPADRPPTPPDERDLEQIPVDWWTRRNDPDYSFGAAAAGVHEDSPGRRNKKVVDLVALELAKGTSVCTVCGAQASCCFRAGAVPRMSTRASTHSVAWRWRCKSWLHTLAKARECAWTDASR